MCGRGGPKLEKGRKGALGKRKGSGSEITISKSSFPVEKWAIGRDTKGSESRNKYEQLCLWSACVECIVVSRVR